MIPNRKTTDRPRLWKQFFEAALKEENLERLPDRIQKAQTAIMNRVEELQNDPDRQPEHDEILDAWRQLNDLEWSIVA